MFVSPVSFSPVRSRLHEIGSLVFLIRIFGGEGDGVGCARVKKIAMGVGSFRPFSFSFAWIGRPCLMLRLECGWLPTFLLLSYFCMALLV